MGGFWGSSKELADGFQGGFAVQLGGAGDGAVAGMDAGTPVGAKAAGNLAPTSALPLKIYCSINALSGAK